LCTIDEGIHVWPTPPTLDASRTVADFVLRFRRSRE
jgi:hypothetical protein